VGRINRCPKIGIMSPDPDYHLLVETMTPTLARHTPGIPKCQNPPVTVFLPFQYLTPPPHECQTLTLSAGQMPETEVKGGFMTERDDGPPLPEDHPLRMIWRSKKDGMPPLPEDHPLYQAFKARRDGVPPLPDDHPLSEAWRRRHDK
jgi:hypothetical protein